MGFVKLRDLNRFTVERCRGYEWKRWNDDEKKMETSPEYAEGFKRQYSVDTDQGTLALSQAQLGQMLAGVYEDGKANIIGRGFNVKTNGKQGMEIRYFINPDWGKPVVKAAQPSAQPLDEQTSIPVPPPEPDHDLPF